MMTRHAKVLETVLRGGSDANILFDDLRGLLSTLGFTERIRGSHHIYTRENVVEVINLQPKGSIMIKYELIVYYSEEDKAFIVEVPELPGCKADGQTYQEAIVNVEVIIQEWIETAKEMGRPIPEAKGRLMFA